MTIGTSADVRSELISLLRGQVACPMISYLAQVGIAQKMLERNEFTAIEIAPALDPSNFEGICDYLLAIGLLEKNRHLYSLTKLGRSVFSRWGSFCLLNSYAGIFNALPKFLEKDGTPPKVDRELNILGSGHINNRKYFSAGIGLIGDASYVALADVGCGDGVFSFRMMEHLPTISLLLVDLSPISVQAAHARIQSRWPSAIIDSCVADASMVSDWIKPLTKMKGGHIIVSLWFIVHEFAGSDADRVIRFFNEIAIHLPNAHIIIGELVALPPAAIASDHGHSILPEYLLFHRLSGQGILSWDAWARVRDSIPYTVTTEIKFDQVSFELNTVPSSFIWLLKPK